MRYALLPVLLVACTLLAGCNGGPKDPRTDDTPTSGHIRIVADEDLRALVETQREVFESLYPKADLEITYASEQEVLRLMAGDSVRCSITCALPGGTQDSLMAVRTVKARPVPICTDGIAVVVGPTSSLQEIGVGQLRDLLNGTDGIAEQKNVALFAGTGSGIARGLVDSLKLTALHARSLPDVDAVLVQVAQDPSAIGLIPFNSISDLDSPVMRARRDQVRLLPVKALESGPAIIPSQSTLADGQYPLRRKVYMVLTEGRSGLGTGFVSFVANHKGQRIFLKRGVAPIKVPTRDVEIVHQ